jgi:hypothetical protein
LITLRTYDAVLEALGGPTRLGLLCDQNANAACTWKATRGKFPSKYYFVMERALREKGYRGPDDPSDLWTFHAKGKPKRIRKPKQARAA